MQQVFLKMVPDGVNPVIYATQNDDGRVFRFKLLNSDESDAYVLNGTETITAKIVKPDNTEITIAITNPGIGKDYCDMVIGSDDCDLAGVYIGEASLLDYGRPLGSINFILKVEPDAYDGANVVVMDCGPADICTFETNLADNLVSLIANITANQDLHGYDHPWAGGGGKNKLPMTNRTETRSGITCTTHENGRLDISGTATEVVSFMLAEYPLKAGSYIINGCVDGGESTWRLRLRDREDTSNQVNSINGDSAVFTIATDTTVQVQFFVFGGYSPNRSFYPMVRLSSVADDTFAPYENICPIVGHSELNLVRCGANLVDFNLKPYSNADEFWLPQGNYYCTLERASGMSTAWYFGAVKTDGTYCSKSELGLDDWSVSGGGYCYGNADKDYFSFSIPDGVSSIKIGRLNADNTIGVMINVGSTALPYSPYNGTTFTVQFGQTVYGGVYDANRGKILCTMRNDNMSDWEWEYNNGYFKTTSIGNIIKKPTSQSTLTNSFCSIFNNVTWEAVGDNDNEYAVLNSNGQLIVKCSSCTDLTQWETLISGQTLCYELATPIEIDVSELSVDTVVGVNNVFADTGETELKYLKIEG